MGQFLKVSFTIVIPIDRQPRRENPRRRFELSECFLVIFDIDLYGPTYVQVHDLSVFRLIPEQLCQIAERFQ